MISANLFGVQLNRVTATGNRIQGNLIGLDATGQQVLAVSTAGVIVGGGGDDTVTRGDGNEMVYGDGGDDTITGSAGNDLIFGFRRRL